MTNKQRMRLGDDGTMDTVIVCADCGEEMRYNYDPSDEYDEDITDEQAFADFLDWALDDAESEHECLPTLTTCPTTIRTKGKTSNG